MSGPTSTSPKHSLHCTCRSCLAAENAGAALLLQQPTVEGMVDGIVSADPWQVQCRECGLVDTKPDNRNVNTWLILAGFLFCLLDRVRRCPGCRSEHRKTCDKCARK